MRERLNVFIAGEELWEGFETASGLLWVAFHGCFMQLLQLEQHGRSQYIFIYLKGMNIIYGITYYTLTIQITDRTPWTKCSDKVLRQLNVVMKINRYTLNSLYKIRMLIAAIQ